MTLFNLKKISNIQNNNDDKYKKLYLKYKKKYLNLKMVGGVKLPSELKTQEAINELELYDNSNSFTEEVFNYYFDIFNRYLAPNDRLLELKENIIDGMLMGKYFKLDGRTCLRAIDIIKRLTNSFYEITQKIDTDFYVYRSINRSAIEGSTMMGDLLYNYIPFSTSYYLESLLQGGCSFGGSYDEVIFLEIKIKKELIYLFIGGSENEITIQPGIIRFLKPYKFNSENCNVIIYKCDFKPFAKEDTIRLIDENAC